MASLFPTDFYNNTLDTKKENELPMLYDYLIDLNTGHLVLDEHKRCIIVSGVNAIVVQSYRKIFTPQGQYFIYSNEYGSKLREFIGMGKSYADTFIEDYLNRCLVSNWKYVNKIKNVTTKLVGNHYIVNFQMETVYGDVKYKDLDLHICPD